MTEETRICKICNEEYPIDHFIRRGEGDLRRWECRSCRKEKSRRWRAENPEDMSRHARKSYLKWKYNISEDDYEQMLISQNYECAICRTTENLGGRRLAIDHCHETGKIRALLCNFCNTALGKFKEDITILQSAINYINYHKQEKEANINGDKLS